MVLIIITGVLLNLLLVAYVIKPLRGIRNLPAKIFSIIAAEASFSTLVLVCSGASRRTVVTVAAVALAGVAFPIARVVYRWACSRLERRRDMEEETVVVHLTGEELFNRLCAYMENKKPFLVEAFTLNDLAAAMFTNTLYLSRTINAYSGKNFRRFVNDYRVEYAMGLFRKNMSLKVSELAELSGFHTVVTFNMAFKLVKGVTPSIWCQSERMRSTLL